MEVLIQFTEQCAHKDDVRQVVQEALGEAGLQVEVREQTVRGDEEARAARVFGSPTVRVNGMDVEYAEREPEETSPGCRYYNTPAGWKPVPPKGMVVRALERAKAQEAAT